MNWNKVKNSMLARNNTPFNPNAPKRSRKRTAPEGEATNTVPITQCPNYEDRRFAAAPGFVGELTKQWRQLRGEA